MSKQALAEKAIFNKYLPEASVDYCYELWKRYTFYFKITPKRESKLGDYRFIPETNRHEITVNGNLSRYSFLVTYLHEVAHLETKVMYKRRVAPHGEEWKYRFRELLKPVMTEEVFPDNVIAALQSYIRNPKASSCADPKLMKALNHEDIPDGMVYVSDLNVGSSFIFKGNIFIKQKANRTRIACLETSSGRKYSFSAAALVKPYNGPKPVVEVSVKKGPVLGDISLETKFLFRQRVFIKKEVRRTMVKCLEAQSGRYYLISKDAPIVLV